MSSINIRTTSGKTHCIHGHELTPENTLTRPNGYRDCLHCKQKQQRAVRAVNPRDQRRVGGPTNKNAARPQS
jgi:hypothetical protein